jgi:hydrogenase expression/formation protein HypC
VCLGVPEKVIEWRNQDPVFGSAVIQFGGIRRECSMACVPEAVPGDYVIVHAGIAIAKIDPLEAEKTLRDLAEINDGLSDFEDRQDD